MRLFFIFICIITVAGRSQWNYQTDSLAVRMILDSSGGCWSYQIDRSVEAITSVKNGRINALYAHGLISFPCTTSQFRPEIGHLTELETLDIANNSLTKLPDELFTLQKLVYLDLNGNSLTTIPAEIGNLRQLKLLHIALNNLSYLPPEIGNIDSLGILDLRFNNLRQLPSTIGNLKQLWWLRLDYNQLDSIPPEIGNLSNLIFLDIYDDSLLVLPATIGNLINLQILDLNSNKLTILPLSICHLRILSRLYLAYNHLRSLPDSIVFLDSLLCTVSGNSLCNQTAPVQAWLDLYAGSDWRLSQKGCDSSAIKFKTKLTSIQKSRNFSKTIIYDIRGRYIGVSENGVLPGSYRAGIYILKPATSSGIKLKLNVVK